MVAMRGKHGGLAAFVTAMALSACVVGETAPQPATGGVVVASPPPPPLAEKSPPEAPPQKGSVWVSGYWHWSGMQYVWVPGHWERARNGRRWRAPRYSIQNGTYVYEPGGWQ